MKTLSGKIVSLKNTATALVEVEALFQHPLYKKFLKKTKRYSVHVDGKTKLSLGQMVTIAACRPMSKGKRFKLVSQKDQA